MGVRPRQKPERLAEKLLTIRNAFGLSQTEIVKRLDAEGMIVASQISEFESGRRAPSWLVLLRYARAANVSMEAIVDDDLDLPDKMPCAKKHEGVRRRRP